MAKKTYRVYGSSKWMGLSGNALLALTNKLGSTRKISIQSIEIYNNTCFGHSQVATTNSPPPQRYHVLRCASAPTGGTDLSITKLDSAAAAFPATVKVRTGAAYTPTYVQWGATTYTDATVAIGDITFTPGSAPGWIANEHRDAKRYLYVASGGNAGYWPIIANTTTDCTISQIASGGFVSAGSTSGIIVEEEIIVQSAVLKTFNPATTISPVSNYGRLNGKWRPSGTIFHVGENSNNQAITIRANESVALVTPRANANMPMFIEATFIVNGTPNYTYKTQFYSFSATETALLTIANDSGSGVVVQLTNISISEVGTQDTPYFQLVPISSIDPATFLDADKKLTPVPFDSSFGALSSSICEVFTNAPVLPFGVPSSYIAEGAPAAATPRGFNYLNSKDFIGPTYMTFFPEASMFKPEVTAFWGTSVPGTFGTHLSQAYSRIKGEHAPIIIREGEAIAIVSGAETATGTTAIGISGWGAFDFAITFSVEPSTQAFVKITNLKANSEVRIFDAGTTTAIGGSESVTGTFQTDIDADIYPTVDISILSLGYQNARFLSQTIGSGLTIIASQVVDRQYENL